MLAILMQRSKLFYSFYPSPFLQRRNSLVGKKRDETKEHRKKDSGRNVLIEKGGVREQRNRCGWLYFKQVLCIQNSWPLAKMMLVNCL